MIFPIERGRGSSLEAFLWGLLGGGRCRTAPPVGGRSCNGLRRECKPLGGFVGIFEVKCMSRTQEGGVRGTS
jgi:hypothetical protein